MQKTLIAVALLLAAALPSVAFANPCDGIDHNLSAVPAGRLAPALAHRMHVQSLEVQGVLKKGDWVVLRVLSVHMEPAELFFSSNPLNNHYIYLWGGVVMDTDTDETDTRNSVLKNVPPPRSSS